MKKTNKAKKQYLKTIGGIAIGLFVGALFMYGIFNLVNHNNSSETHVDIESELLDIDEWSTQEFKYSNMLSSKSSRELFGVDIPFTTQKVTIYYEGVIKAGFVSDDIRYNYNETTKTINVSLPEEPIVFDNYIILDNLKVEEENNIFNPLRISDVSTYFEGIEEKELEKAIKEHDFYNATIKHTQERIKSKLESVYKDYEVVFD